MNSIRYDILVFGQTNQQAINYLDYLVGEMQVKQIKNIKKTKDDYRVELFDGRTYKAVPASQSSRGYRCDVAFVDKLVDQEIIDCVIKPCLCGSKIPPDEQIIYYDFESSL